jgi:hypothetical protein
MRARRDTPGLRDRGRRGDLSRWRRRLATAPLWVCFVVDQAVALRKGRLPEDADPETWRSHLERQERTQRRLRVIAPIEFGAFAALDIWLAFTQGAVWWVFLALFVAFGVGGVVATAATLGRIDRLRQQLGGSPVT